MSTEERRSLNEIVPEILFDEPMNKHTYVGIGGPASAYARPSDTTELKSLLSWCTERGKDWCYVGNGSNLLITDKGIKGIAISLERGFGKFGVAYKRDEHVYVYAEGGVPTSTFVNWLADEGFGGLEFLGGVPGTIGGNTFTNAGGKDGSVGDFIEEITAIDRHGKEITFRKQSLRFAYRKLHMPKSTCIAKVLFKLKEEDKETIKTKLEKNRAKRQETQPQGVRTFGSTFKNPPRNFAGRLIEESGLKGVRVGGARVSLEHANFIVNEGEAKAKDIMILMDLMRQRVKERYGILLEPEVHVVGEK